MSDNAAPRQAPSIASWAKPFSAAWRARAYFSIAALFWVLDSTIPVPFSSLPPGDRLWWQVLIAKAFGSFDKISYAAFLAGLVYAVLSDSFEYIWSNSMQAEVRIGFASTGEILRNTLSSFASGLIGMSYEAIKVWVEGGRGTPDQMKLIGITSLRTYYGPHNSGSDNLLDFITDDIVENSAFASSQTWENYVTNVTLRKSIIAGHFEWEERKNYDVVCSGRSGTLPMRLETSAKIGRSQIKQTLDNMDYNIDFGGKNEVNLRKFWSRNKDKITDTTFKIEEDGVSIEYDGIWLSCRFSRDCKITQERTPVVIYEKSFISEQDRCYSIAVRHPTRGLQATLSIEGIEGWAVKTPVVSARLYKRGEKVVATESHHLRVTTARVRGWTLPGLAIIIEWAPE